MRPPSPASAIWIAEKPALNRLPVVPVLSLDPSCELLLSRIRQRIATGGHAVPDQDVRRRYDRSLKNLKTYTAIMDKIRIFDNSGMKPVLVYEKNDEAIVYDTVRFAQMKLEIALWRHP